MKKAELTNSIDPDEVAHYEPSHLGLHCLASSLEFSVCYSLDKMFIKFCRYKFRHLLFGT